MRKFYSIIVSRKKLEYFFKSFLLIFIIVGINMFFFSSSGSSNEVVDTCRTSVEKDNLAILGFVDTILKWIESTGMTK